MRTPIGVLEHGVTSDSRELARVQTFLAYKGTYKASVAAYRAAGVPLPDWPRIISRGQKDSALGDFIAADQAVADAHHIEHYSAEETFKELKKPDPWDVLDAMVEAALSVHYPFGIEPDDYVSPAQDPLIKTWDEAKYRLEIYLSSMVYGLMNWKDLCVMLGDALNIGPGGHGGKVRVEP